MKPYPLALLNHFTVPCKRSTCAPSARTLLAYEAVPSNSCHCASEERACQGLPAGKPLPVRLGRFSLLVQPEHARDGFSISYCPTHYPANSGRQGNHALLNDFISLGLRGSGTQPTREINVHSLGH